LLNNDGPIGEKWGEGVMLCSENRLFREGLRQIIMTTIAVVGEASSLVEAQLSLRSGDVTPSLIVCDAERDSAAGFQTLKAITQEFPAIGVVVLADQLSQRDLELAITSGARGFLPKDLSAEALQISLALIGLGEDIFAAPASLKVANHAPGAFRSTSTKLSALRSPLSPREGQILRCLEGGLPNKTIARDLDMAEATVKVHLKALLRKINVENRTQAAVWAMNNLDIMPQAADASPS